MIAALKILRFVLTVPVILWGWGYVLLFTMIYAAHKWSFDTSEFILTAEWRPWVLKFWKYSTTVSRGIIYQPGVAQYIRDHEMVHVRQFEDRAILALIVALIVGVGTLNIWWFLGLWGSSVLWLLPNLLGSVLRGGDAYRDTEHERSAFAQTDPKQEEIDYK